MAQAPSAPWPLLCLPGLRTSVVLLRGRGPAGTPQILFGAEVSSGITIGGAFVEPEILAVEGRQRIGGIPQLCGEPAHPGLGTLNVGKIRGVRGELDFTRFQIVDQCLPKVIRRSSRGASVEVVGQCGSPPDLFTIYIRPLKSLQEARSARAGLRSSRRSR
jgi:hypothetical protein